MAFYKDLEHKSRREKQNEAFRKGGYEEDRGYGKPAGGAKGPHGAKSSYGSKPAFGGKPTYGAKPAYGAKPTYGDKPSFGGKSAYGSKPSYGAKSAYGDKSSFGGKSAYGSKPSYGAKSAYGDKPSFGGKSAYGSKPSYGAKPAYGDKPSYGGKPAFGKKPSFGGKPAFEKAPFRSSGVSFEDYRYHAPAAEPPRLEPEDAPIPPENLLVGRNPIREAIRSGRDFEKLMIAKGELSGSAREIIAMARENHIMIQEVERIRLDAIARNHQGMIAFTSAYTYSTLEKMLALAEERGEEPFLVILDGITDPHNLGAIIRSAECAGAHGVLLQERRAVGLTPAAVKASAGAVEYMPVARVTNLNALLNHLKARGIWIYAADMAGEDFASCDFSGGVALVIGAEGDGISHHVLESCDKRVSLPMKGHVDSLNASVAAGILMYSIMNARRG